MAPTNDIRVLINRHSGKGAAGSPGDLTRAFARHGLGARVIAVPGDRLAQAARAAVADQVDLVVAGGGDGTINTIAAALAGSATRLAVLPLGTLNHFARDLGMPRDVDAAIAAIAAGHDRLIDLGEVNGRIFLNNSSIGVYPALVLQRDQERRAFRRGKYQAMALAIARSARRLPVQRVRLAIAGRSLLRLTPFVFIANNAYSWKPTSFARRRCLDDGRLWCYFPTRHGALGLGRNLLATALGGLAEASDLAGLPVTEFTLHSRRRLLAVALDGEVRHLRPPLHYRILPHALRVVVPSVEAACA